MPGLLVSMAPEYPAGGLEPGSGIYLPRPSLSWRGPLNPEEAVLWLSGTKRGWACGDWLTFAVLDVSQNNVVGHVGLNNRDGGQVATGGRGEIGYWTAAAARGRGIAPAAVRTVTDWAFGHFGGERLPAIMLVHDMDNPASCRVALKSGYPFRELSPANPPCWFTDGHIHLAEATVR
jgi:RimJ/RimL family protein N-acetyltransferase